MNRAPVLVLLSALVVLGCERNGGGPAAGGGVADEARALIERGEYDAALARLGDSTDAESLYLLGRAWAGKARLSGPARGQTLGLEEQQALAFLERAVEARPDHARAQLAMAELLAPHALATPAGAGGKDTAPRPGVTVARVLAAYGAAIQADPADTEAVERLIEFATRAGRAAEVEAGYREWVRRDRENPEVLVRFGDFLAGPGDDPQEALGVYAQALMWRPDDEATRLKIADIHMAAARGYLEADQYAGAEARLREARKYVGSGSGASPQASRLRALEARLADASGRR
jgi:tetratricopeptide (TPR) repeat protein